MERHRGYAEGPDLAALAGLLAEERQGRHRYVRLANADTAELVENLASMAPRRVAPPRSLSAASRASALARAHLL